MEESKAREESKKKEKMADVEVDSAQEADEVSPVWKWNILIFT